MLKSIRDTLLLLACSLLLLHNFTPHIHQSEQGVKGPVVKLSVAKKVGLLQDVFQIDLGCNHLEEANQSKFDYTPENTTFNYFIPTLPQELTILKIASDFELIQISKESNPSIYPYQSLRAPPLSA